MTDTFIINAICWTVMAFCMIKLFKEPYKIYKEKRIQKSINNLRKKENPNTSGVFNVDLTDPNPLNMMYNALANIYGMNPNKLLLNDAKDTLGIAYGKACVIILEKREETLAVALCLDKTIKLSEKERDKELAELKELLDSMPFESSNTVKVLAFLTTAINRIEKEKFSDITRQLPIDML